jgi:hypothetical protein
VARAEVEPGQIAGPRIAWVELISVRRIGALFGALARPWVATAVALLVYLLRAAWGTQLARSDDAYFNYLAEAFLHGQTYLRQTPPHTLDLVYYGDRIYLYWPPFPAVLVAPLVALFGVGVSDRLYTVVIAALAIGLLARLLAALDLAGVAPLDATRRGILVVGVALGSFLLILAPAGNVWSTAQLLGWACTILAALAAVAVPDARGYVLAGLALAAAMATRNSLALNGLWLAYYLLWRDRRLPWRTLAGRAALGIAPLAVTLTLLGLYNVARFGDPLQLGLPWHNMHPIFRADYERYGLFNLHYLPTNLHYQFIAYDLFNEDRWQGSGLFWMSPLLLGAPYALWRGWRRPLVWALMLTCVLVYAPIGLLMGTGYFQFGPRYLLDLLTPLLVLTALGVRRWPLWLLGLLLAIGVGTYAAGSWLWWATLRV